MSVYKGRFLQAYILLIAVVAILNRGGERAMNFGASAAPLSSLAHSIEPAVGGVANPIDAGVGKGIAAAAAGTQQPADSPGDAAYTLYHALGGVAANTEPGAGVAVAKTGYAAQSTVSDITSNSGALGTVAKLAGGG